MKLSEVIRKSIELSLNDFAVNDTITAEDIFDNLRDMYHYYEAEKSMDELEEEE
jgi:hypothetical protein